MILIDLTSSSRFFQKVLNQLSSYEFGLLEDWFMTRLLGKTEDAAAQLRLEEPKYIVSCILFPKLPWSGDIKGTFRSSS